MMLNELGCRDAYVSWTGVGERSLNHIENLARAVWLWQETKGLC